MLCLGAQLHVKVAIVIGSEFGFDLNHLSRLVGTGDDFGVVNPVLFRPRLAHLVTAPSTSRILCVLKHISTPNSLMIPPPLSLPLVGD